jgi:hypothetical protein
MLNAEIAEIAEILLAHDEDFARSACSPFNVVVAVQE